MVIPTQEFIARGIACRATRVTLPIPKPTRSHVFPELLIKV